MRSDRLKRFLNSDVVGQLKDGLFFEGHVRHNSGKASVFDLGSEVPRQISAARVKWLAKAARYC